MRATGILRRIDDLGRIVIPKEIRKNLRINEGDSLEIYTDDNMVIFKKFKPFLSEQQEMRAKTVTKYIRDIVDVHYNGNTIRVIFSDGNVSEATKADKDTFNLIDAIYYALYNAGRLTSAENEYFS